MVGRGQQFLYGITALSGGFRHENAPGVSQARQAVIPQTEATTMQPTQSAHKKIAPEPVDSLPDRPAKIGVDADGRTHYLGNFVFDKRVFVADNDSIEAFDLAETPCDDMADWLDHVDETVGWQTCHARMTLGELFVEALRR